MIAATAGAALRGNVSAYERDRDLVGEYGAPRGGSPDLPVPWSERAGVSCDVSRRPLDPARYFVPSQLFPNADQDLDTVRRHGDRFDDPLADSTLVAQ